MIEDVLRAARIHVPEYTAEQRLEDERRLNERIQKINAFRALASCFGEAGWLLPTSPELSVLLQGCTDAASQARVDDVKERLEQDLKTLCRGVLKAEGAADRLVEFAEAARRTDPVGALA